MRKSLALIIVAVTVLTAVPALAELQNVLVGGQIRIRGNWYSAETTAGAPFGRNPIFQWPWTWSSRPNVNGLLGLRWAAQPGRFAVGSPYAWDDRGNNNAFVEQRTRLNVRADFTDQVSAFVELDSYDVWGEDFRSNYITGVDARAWTGDDVEVYQAYIEAKEMFGYPLHMRIGRQELKFGSGWLIDTNDTASYYFGRSFDGLRLGYATDLFSVDAVWAKLAENSPIEEDSDVDLYGVYGSYLGIEDITLDAYWFLVRDGLARKDTNTAFLASWIEDLFGVDDYDPTYLHTIGLRGAGTIGAFDFEAEAAYQWGDAGSVGALFAGAGRLSPYGDDEAEFSGWAGNLELGYTFDMAWTPRVFLGGAYFDGEDNRDLNFWQWLGAVACPYWSVDSSVSFNRLFSNWEYSPILDNGNLSNMWLARGGITVNPTESLKWTVSATYFQTLEAYESHWPVFSLFGTRVVLFPNMSFWSKENSDDLGWEVATSLKYAYSEDLSFEVGYTHLFTGDGLAEGNFNQLNGLGFNGGIGDDDADYAYFETKVSF